MLVQIANFFCTHKKTIMEEHTTIQSNVAKSEINFRCTKCGKITDEYEYKTNIEKHNPKALP